MKIEEIDAISYKNNKPKEVKENVVQDETITLTINNDISRSLSAIEDSLKEFAVGYMFNENMLDSMDSSFIIAKLENAILALSKTYIWELYKFDSIPTTFNNKSWNLNVLSLNSP